MILDQNQSSLYGATFLGLDLGLAWTLTSLPGSTPPPPIIVTATTGSIAGHRRHRKKKHAIPGDWPGMIWPTPQEDPVLAEAPEPVISTAIAPAPVAIAAISLALRQALAGKLRPGPLTITDPAVQRRIDALKLKMKLEREDEETLMMLGFFD